MALLLELQKIVAITDNESTFFDFLFCRLHLVFRAEMGSALLLSPFH